jgi:hypothetical protein
VSIESLHVVYSHFSEALVDDIITIDEEGRPYSQSARVTGFCRVAAGMQHEVQEAIPRKLRDRLNAHKVEMAELTAVRWMITLLTQELLLMDVIGICTYLISDDVANFNHRLKVLCDLCQGVV